MPAVKRLPDGTYEVRISVVDPTTGKRHQPRVRARSRRELDNAVAETRSRILRGDVQEPDTTPLGDYLDQWFSTYRPPKSATRANRRGALLRVQRDEIARIPLGRLRRAHVQGFVDRLALTHAPRTVRETIAVLGMALDRAATILEIIPQSPATKLALPSQQRQPMTVWDREEVRAVLRAVAGTDDEAFWQLALALGVRIGELVALRWSDVELDRGRITIARTMTRDERDRLYIGDTAKSPASHRAITLPLPCQAALAAQRRRSLERRLALGGLWDPADAVFDNGTGAHWRSARRFRNLFLSVVAATGVTPIRPHDMRHTAATHMIWAGVPIPTVSRILGHANPAITLRIYAHVIETMEEQAADIIGGMYQERA